MATAARAFHCHLQSIRDDAPRRVAVPIYPAAVAIPKVKLQPGDTSPDKILLQPRLCTLRSYGSDPPIGMIRKRKESCDEVPPFFETLSEYIESSKKSHDFEIISGRLAMLPSKQLTNFLIFPEFDQDRKDKVIFAATIAEEAVTGTSVFRKMDVQGIAEAAGACLVAVTSAAVFAWVSSGRLRVGRIINVSCNSFIDSLIDQIVDGLFYQSELSDWSDEI